MEASWKKHIVGIGAVVLAVALVGGVMYATRSNPLTSIIQENQEGISIDADGEYTLEMLPVGEMPEAPEYSRPLSFTLTFSVDERAALQTNYARAQAAIDANEYDFNAWVSLGTLNLMAGNYTVARDVWEYVSILWPGNHVSVNNLGNLYADYLRDYPKAEENYLLAIERKPDDTNPYRALFMLYTNTSYSPAPNASEEILKKAIVAVPRAVDMQVLLARHYASLGRTGDARTTYDAAIANAESQGQAALAAQIQTERSAL